MRIVNIQPSWINSNEHKACALAGFDCQYQEILSPNAIGIGSVDYCRKINNWTACDPYPRWLPWGREIYRGGVIPNKPLFYKPIDIPKRFNSRVMMKPPDTPWIASDVVNFVSEWRAYIILGRVVGVFCYSDFDNDDHCEFIWHIPGGITAAIDFGLTDDGRILPIEVNDPYSIGWYGRLSQYQIYADFIVYGWDYMRGKKY